MGNYSSAMNAPPDSFRFTGSTATVNIRHHEAQNAIDHFKTWLPKATAVLKHQLVAEAQKAEADRHEALRRQREAEEIRLRVNSTLRI
jgi:hypothetical protein